jgi:hypothetical protein
MTDSGWLVTLAFVDQRLQVAAEVTQVVEAGERVNRRLVLQRVGHAVEGVAQLAQLIAAPGWHTDTVAAGDFQGELAEMAHWPRNEEAKQQPHADHQARVDHQRHPGGALDDRPGVLRYVRVQHDE